MADLYNSAPSFSIYCSNTGSVRIFDSASARHDFGPHLPGITAADADQVRLHARDWKIVHKLTEQIFSRTLELRDALYRFRSERNEAARNEVVRLLDTAFRYNEPDFFKLESLHGSVRRSAPIDFLLRTNICFSALADQLVVPVFDSKTEQAVMLCERLCNWFHSGLVTADAMLEFYFEETEPR